MLTVTGGRGYNNSGGISVKNIAVLVIIVICGLFFGCDIEEQKPGISTIKNTSETFNVNYKFKDNIDHVIAKKSEENYDRPLNDYIVSYEPSKRVLLDVKFPYKNDVIYTFIERDSYIVKVKNTIGENATLSADGWMDTMIDIIPEYTDDANHTGIIYSIKPNFTVTTVSGFPAEAVFNLINDTFMVVIK